MISVARTDYNSITFDNLGKFGGAQVLLKRAPEGTGVISGGAARAVVELAGIRNIRTKSLGSNNKQNVVFATLAALKGLKTPEEVARLRGKSVDEIKA
jgi:small subunit ribosomal protein S5